MTGPQSGRHEQDQAHQQQLQQQHLMQQAPGGMPMQYQAPFSYASMQHGNAPRTNASSAMPYAASGLSLNAYVPYQGDPFAAKRDDEPLHSSLGMPSAAAAYDPYPNLALPPNYAGAGARSFSYGGGFTCIPGMPGGAPELGAFGAPLAHYGGAPSVSGPPRAHSIAGYHQQGPGPAAQQSLPQQSMPSFGGSAAYHHQQLIPPALAQNRKASSSAVPGSGGDDARRRSSAGKDGSGAASGSGHSDLQPTYFGMVKTTIDAIKLLAATDLPDHTPNRPPRRISRRLLDAERASLVRAGTVFAWDEKEAGMRRWTDGRCWSASRVSGCFLTYRELEVRKHRNGAPGGPTANQYKIDGLIKQSFSMTTGSGRKMHVINYYTKRELREDSLRRVSQDPRFDNAPGSNGWEIHVDEVEFPDPALAQQEEAAAAAAAAAAGGPSDEGKGGDKKQAQPELPHRLSDGSAVSSESGGGSGLPSTIVSAESIMTGKPHLLGSGLVGTMSASNSSSTDGYGSATYHSHQQYLSNGYGRGGSGGASSGGAGRSDSSTKQQQSHYQPLSQHNYRQQQPEQRPSLPRLRQYLPQGQGAPPANGTAGRTTSAGGVGGRTNGKASAKASDRVDSAYTTTPLSEARGLFPIAPIPVKSSHFSSGNHPLQHQPAAVGVAVGDGARSRDASRDLPLPHLHSRGSKRSAVEDTSPPLRSNGGSFDPPKFGLSLSYLPAPILPTLGSRSRSLNHLAHAHREDAAAPAAQPRSAGGVIGAERLMPPLHDSLGRHLSAQYKRRRYDSTSTPSSDSSGSDSDARAHKGASAVVDGVINGQQPLSLPPLRRPPLRQRSRSRERGSSGENEGDGAGTRYGGSSSYARGAHSSSFRSSASSSNDSAVPSLKSSRGTSRGGSVSDQAGSADDRERRSGGPLTPSDGAAPPVALPRLLALDVQRIGGGLNAGQRAEDESSSGNSPPGSAKGGFAMSVTRSEQESAVGALLSLSSSGSSGPNPGSPFGPAASASSADMSRGYGSNGSASGGSSMSGGGRPGSREASGDNSGSSARRSASRAEQVRSADMAASPSNAAVTAAALSIAALSQAAASASGTQTQARSRASSSALGDGSPRKRSPVPAAAATTASAPTGHSPTSTPAPSSADSAALSKLGVRL